MASTRPHAELVDLDALDAFLMSDRAPEDAMDLSVLDGFLTAIVVGPELIMPSEWLPLVWGGEEPVFDDIDEAQAVLSLIMARYSEIVSGVLASGEGWAPVFWETPGGEVIVTDWAAGFLEAMRLRPDAWMPLFEDREASPLLMPIILAGSDENVAEEIGMAPEDEERFLEAAVEGIPLCVIGIDMFWKDRRRTGVRSRSGPRRSPKIGRNEPCPCGSGKKYKRCCGAK